MRLSRYRILLESLNAEHLEMVRLWRNQDYIRKNMHFQGLLSRADQQGWFNQLDSKTNLYWIIHFNEYPIGLIHIKDIDLENRVGEAGIFIGEPSYLEMPQPMLAILFMMELGFLVFGMKKLRAKIKSGNQRAIQFNEQLGYELERGQPEGFQYYSVDKERFLEVTEEIRNRAVKMYGGQTGLMFDNASSDWNHPLENLSQEAISYFKPTEITG